MFGDFIEPTALDEFHAEIARAVALADFVDRNNLRMFQTRCCLRFVPKTLQVRRARPLAEPDHLERDGAIKAFLPRAINHALSAATNLFEQLVVAKLHLDSMRLLLATVVVLERSQSSSEHTHATKSAWRIAKNCRAAFCAHALNFVNLSTQSRSSLLCTDRNFVKGYAWSTEMKWRSSSPTSPGTATVWAISSRNNCR